MPTSALYRLILKIGDDVGIVPYAGSIRRLGFAAAQVLTGTGVDLDLVALVDEEGHLHLSAGLNGSGLGDVGSGVAGEARLGLGNNQVNKLGTSTPKTLPL